MASGASVKCRSCPSKLLGTEVAGGRCGVCERGIKTQVNRLTAPLVTVPRPTVTVPIEDVTVPVRKQRKWERNNPEKTKADTAARVAKWRRRRADTGNKA